MTEAKYISTARAAELLDLKPQTMRRWTMLGCGPIKPTKSGNRLLWSEDAVIKLVACRDREREVRAYEKAAQEAEKAERKAAREAAKHAAN